MVVQACNPAYCEGGQIPEACWPARLAPQHLWPAPLAFTHAPKHLDVWTHEYLDTRKNRSYSV